MSRRDFDPATVRPDGRPAIKGLLFDPDKPGPWRGALDGAALDGSVTVLAYGTETPGEGPPSHVHPYDETFIVTQGRARFYVGDQVIDAEAGEVVLGPKGVPYHFENLGPGRLLTIDIHHSPRWIQTNLDSV